MITVGPQLGQADSNSSQPSMSADGRLVVFASDATNLVPEPTHGARGVYLKDTQTGELVLVSSDAGGVPADDDSEHPDISADGRYVVFDSQADNLVSDELPTDCTNEMGLDEDCKQIYLKDLESGDIKLVSSDSGGMPAAGINASPAVSADGRYVAFVSSANDLVPDDNNRHTDIFVKDTHSSEIKIVSVTADGDTADGASDMPAISADGGKVAFKSMAENLTEAAGNNATDVFVSNVETGEVTLASSDSGGLPGNKASGYDALDISADGRFVAFESESTNLVSGDDNQRRDVFLKNIATGEIVLVSADTGGNPGEEDSYASVSLSADGRLVAFSSNANNLVSGDSTNKEDVFIKDVDSGEVIMISTSSVGDPGNGKSTEIAISSDGTMAAFSSEADNLISDDTNGKADIFVKDLATGDIMLASVNTASGE